MLTDGGKIENFNVNKYGMETLMPELSLDELMQNWELAKDGKPLNRINPLI